MNPTENEQLILRKMRELRPFEKLEITADKRGVPDTYVIVRSRTEKILLEEEVDPKYFK